MIGDDFSICLQNIEDQDIHVEWFDNGMQIAHKIINMHPEYYNFQQLKKLIKNRNNPLGAKNNDSFAKK